MVDTRRQEKKSYARGVGHQFEMQEKVLTFRACSSDFLEEKNREQNQALENQGCINPLQPTLSLSLAKMKNCIST